MSVQTRRPGTVESVYARLAREGRENAPMVERCARCPEWSFTGTAAECLVAGADHRADLHPETVGWKRPVRKKPVKNTTEKRPVNGAALNGALKTTVKKTRSVSRGGGRVFITAEKARELHERNTGGASVLSIAKSVWRELGYKNEQACDSAIRYAFRRDGLAAVKYPPKERPAKAYVPPQSFISPERLAELHARHLAGESVYAIAVSTFAELGYRNENSCQVSLRRAFSRAGLELRLRPRGCRTTRRKDAPPALTPDRVAAAAEIYRAGISLEALAVVAHDPWGFASQERLRRDLSVALRDAGVALRERGRDRQPIPLLNRAQVDDIVATAA